MAVGDVGVPHAAGGRAVSKGRICCRAVSGRLAGRGPREPPGVTDPRGGRPQLCRYRRARMDGPCRLPDFGQNRSILPRAGRSRPVNVPARIEPGAASNVPSSECQFMPQAAATDEKIDLAGMVADLNSLLRLKTTVIGMKMFARAEDMAAIPKIRRPIAVHTTDQIVSMASRLGWTVGITADDLVGAQCRAVIGLAPQDEKWLAGQAYVGVWHGTAEDARKRQEALDVVAFGQYKALAVSPLASGRLNPPDICLVYATPGQMIILINGLQWTGYRKFKWGVVGEKACADSWGHALKTGER